jgi:hypothetical protein
MSSSLQLHELSVEPVLVLWHWFGNVLASMSTSVWFVLGYARFCSFYAIENL